MCCFKKVEIVDGNKGFPCFVIKLTKHMIENKGFPYLDGKNSGDNFKKSKQVMEIKDFLMCFKHVKKGRSNFLYIA